MHYITGLVALAAVAQAHPYYKRDYEIIIEKVYVDARGFRFSTATDRTIIPKTATSQPVLPSSLLPKTSTTSSKTSTTSSRALTTASAAATVQTTSSVRPTTPSTTSSRPTTTSSTTSRATTTSSSSTTARTTSSSSAIVVTGSPTVITSRTTTASTASASPTNGGLLGGVGGAVGNAVGVANLITSAATSPVRTRTGFVAITDPLFAQMSVYHTNVHRANHSAGPVTWDQSLADKAQIWSNLCIFDEGVGRPDGTGVNAAWSSSGVFNPSDFISDAWYNGEFANYPFGAGDNVDVTGPAFESFGHLSQLVWNTTTTIGCGIRNDCPGTWKSAALCYYSPPGNYIGAFSSVKVPVGGPILRGNGK